MKTNTVHVLAMTSFLRFIPDRRNSSVLNIDKAIGQKTPENVPRVLRASAADEES